MCTVLLFLLFCLLDCVVLRPRSALQSTKYSSFLSVGFLWGFPVATYFVYFRRGYSTDCGLRSSSLGVLNSSMLVAKTRQPSQLR